jgi:hypothetical protein
VNPKPGKPAPTMGPGTETDRTDSFCCSDSAALLIRESGHLASTQEVSVRHNHTSALLVWGLIRRWSILNRFYSQTGACFI